MSKKVKNLGIALSDKELLIVQSQTIKSKAVIDKWGQIELPPGMVKEGRITNLGEVNHIAQNLLNELKVQTNSASINIPPQFITLKEIEINRELLNAFPDWFKWEMNNVLLEPVNTFSISAFNMGISFSPGSGLFTIAAVPNEILSERILLIESLGLNLIAVDPDPVATYNCFIFGEDTMPSGKILFVNIENHNTSIFLVNEGRFVYGGVFPAYREIINSIVRGIPPTSEIITKFAEILTSNYNSYFKAIGLNMASKKPTKIYFTGSIITPEICDSISLHLNVPSQTENPFNQSGFKISFKKKPDLNWAKFFLPVGLALRKTDE